MAETRKQYAREFKLEGVRILDKGEKPGHQIEKDPPCVWIVDASSQKDLIGWDQPTNQIAARG